MVTRRKSGYEEKLMETIVKTVHLWSELKREY